MMSDEEQKNALGRPGRLFENVIFVKYSKNFKNFAGFAAHFLCGLIDSDAF